ncbi:MAG: ATP phosphoribosyltransferase, partial [Chloroflexota bacterium]
RENHLKALPGGVVVEAQACMVGNRRALRDNPAVVDAARVMLEHIDAAVQGHGFSQVTVNIHGESAEEIARRVAANPITRGLQGPTIAPIHGTESDWHTVTVIIANGNLLRAVEYLRELGGTQCIVVPVRYVFLEKSPTFARLQESIGS